MSLCIRTSENKFTMRLNILENVKAVVGSSLYQTHVTLFGLSYPNTSTYVRYMPVCTEYFHKHNFTNKRNSVTQ